MKAQGFSVFETAIGWSAIVWSERGIVRAWLPETDAVQVRARVRKRFRDLAEAAPPAHLRPTVDGICALLRGEAADLSGAPLDLDGVPPFNQRVYEIARAIPPGETLTYGEIAAKLGDLLLARAVGQALGENPVPILVPCHRVLGSGGKFGGFSAPGGVETKARLLTIEGARTSAEPLLFDRLPVATPRR